MNVQVIEVVRRSDGKLNPSPWPVPDDEAKRVRRLVHQLRCGQGLSIRQTQRVMREQHATRRSIGRIHAILVNFECARCRDDG